ncbi:MAG TPA: hypothetical protein VIK15_04770 [Candidatus Anoxymicrobiaceae bacterium]
MKTTTRSPLIVATALLACAALSIAACGLAMASPRSAGVAPPQVNRSWYFAEGSTDWGFEEFVCIQNPTPSDAVVQAKYMLSSGAGQIAGAPFLLPSYSRATINVADVVPGADVAVRVDSDKDVVCERSMYWGGRVEGHDSIGVPAPSNTWFLAEGCTDYGFEEYVCIQNPGTKNSTVNITYNTPAGPRKRAPLAVAALSRKTIKVNDDVPASDVSTTVNATQPVVAERSMYWGSRRGGHDSIGTTTSATKWFMAEGSTKWGFDTFVLVQNPSATDASVNMTFLTENGPRPAPAMVVKAGGRKTVDTRAIIGNADFSTSVTASVGVICERSMYWNNGTGKAGHDTIGVTEPKYNCFLAEGTTLYGFETFVLIANPNDVPNDVVIQYMTPQGVEPGAPLTIPPWSRVTVNVNGEIPGSDVSVQVIGSLKIVAERAMYWHNRGGGHDSIGYMTDDPF